ncbi:hypothetical protein TWF106_004475 [Orbilia oligospora]|uniref:Uncharacterized protein n=1 Tax=Orbilia oligospora TaxID=2813651 RepID=A0A7C8U6G3_ORBOL|nr:hypothetical protein TWF106_004475 [Orbilia oligospora]
MPYKDLVNMTASLIITSTPNQLSTPDEEVAAEPDEPSDNCNCNLSTVGKLQFQENMYKKQTVNPRRSNKVDSLLTRAIISDSEPHSADNAPSIYSRVAFRVPRRGMSTTSTISSASMPSTADLTSDAGDDSSSSELSSPSPRNAPVFVLPIRDTVAIKTHSDDELHKSTVQADPNEVTAALGRKRCITFACPTPVSRQNSENPKPQAIEEPTPVRRTTLKFACNVKDECKAPKRAGSPPPPQSKFAHRSPVLNATHLHPNSLHHNHHHNHHHHHRRDSGATIIDERHKAIPCKASPLISSVSSANSIPRFYEFASSVDESVQSWMNAPQFPPRLIKVDCLLEKEKQIRKLSEEVEEDENNDDDDEDNDNLDFEDDDEEDDGYKEDEEDDDYDDDDDNLWSDSDDNGNDDEDEEGLVESDNEDDAFVPRVGTAIPDRKADRPSCCRNSSDSSLASVHDRKSGLCSFQREKHIHGRPIRPSTPELPDSTDFVPGTFDEDKVLEDFYLSCMEDRKSMNKVVRPQDIDPSFPEGGEDDDEEGEDEEAERPARRRRGSNVSVRSPTPNRRLRSPPPMSRRGSRAMSPGKRRPSFTAKSPPPQGRTGRLRFDLQANRASLARSTSLPRHGLYSRRKHCLSSTSPKPSKAIPFRKRCALDIVKGLESKRMRRRENVYGRREYKAEAGEGVEKMREIGIMGRERVGANPAPKWMLSF